MRSWILKTEPSEYSFERLMAEGRTRWDGITNNLALLHLRAMRRGDRAIVYHTGDERSAVGTAQITRDPYPDPNVAGNMRIDLELQRPPRATTGTSGVGYVLEDVVEVFERTAPLVP